MRNSVKAFEFNEQARRGLTFSDASKIRLNPRTFQLELSVQRHGRGSGRAEYPLDAGLTVTTANTNPENLARWSGFEVSPREQPAGTSVGLKLNDGTDDRYWDGAAWSVAGAADWSTEDEVAANITTYPVTKNLSIVINLVTTDKHQTPTVKYIALMMDVEFDHLASLIGDSLAVSLAAGIQPQIEQVMRVDGGTQVSLRTLDTDYNIVSVDRAYDHTNDPDHLVDLLSSYDAADKYLNLSSAMEAGDAVWVLMTVEPEVYVNYANQDYIEVERLPAIVIESIAATGNKVHAKCAVKDKTTNTAKVLREPYKLNIDMTISLIASRSRPLLKMWEEALSHAQENSRLRWRAIDEYVSLETDLEGNYTPRPNLHEDHSATYSIRLEDVYLWLKPAEVVPLIQRVNLTLNTPELYKGPRWSGVRTC